MSKLIALIILIPLNIFGQSSIENDILLTTKKVNGVYRTFKEFRTNSPSIKGTLEVTKHRIKLLNHQTGKFENIKESFWGACINDTIYVFLKEPSTVYSPNIHILEFLGRYCYFIDQGEFTSRSGSTWSTSSYKFEYVVNINNGIIYRIDKKLMRQILEKDPELLNEFEKESSKKTVYRDYLEKLNSRRQADIKPIEIN